MKVLFIGGTGVISSACSELCVKSEIELYLLNRGTSFRLPAKGSELIKADIRSKEDVISKIKNYNFDVVVDWVAYNTDHIMADYEVFKEKTAQYIFISTASAYQKPPSKIPVTEAEPIHNPYWNYSQQKVYSERKLMELFRNDKFPVTIVRPSHTYDKTKVPLYTGYTVLNRILNGKKVIVHGDGTSLWVLTHHKDFAKGLIGLFGKSESIGEAYHITSDEVLTWNAIARILGDALGVRPNIIHVPSDIILHFDKEWGDNLMGDKSYSMIFDNSKIKKINPDYKAEIPFSKGAEEIIEWYRNEKNRQIDQALDQRMDLIIKKFESITK